MEFEDISAEQKIVEYLSQPSEVRAALFPEIDHIAIDYAAQVDTFHFLKKCSLPPFQLYTVQYETKAGELLHSTCCLEQDSMGQWRVRSCIEINIKDRYAMTEQQHQFHAGQPWVQLSGGGGAPFWAVGDVIANGFEITSVRLRSKNGYVLEDIVQDGYVIFLSNQKIQVPIEVEIYNSSGALLRMYPWLDQL